MADAGYKRLTQINLEESGASTADAVFTQADDADLTVANQEISAGVYADQLEFLLSTVDTTVNPDIGGTVNLYCMPIDIEGTADANVPNANYPNQYITSFEIDDDQTLTQAVVKRVENPFPGVIQRYYIENQCGQTISAAWNLRVTPLHFNSA